MTHPDRFALAQAAQQRRCRIEPRLGAAKFAARRVAHPAPQLMHEQLQAVADAEDRQPGGVEGRVGTRGGFVIDGTGTAGENDAPGFERRNIAPRSIAGQDGAEDMQLANTARD